MSFTLSLDEIKLTDHARVGDKAAHLGELIAAGFDVPRGYCISADAYRDTLGAQDIKAKIAARLAQTEIDDPVELEDAAEEIRGWIETAAIPPAITQEIQVALAALNTSALFAVRASRVVEDVPNPAASGLQQAFLAVPANDVIAHVRQCWSSPWNSRAIYFRNRKKIDQGQVTMAVVIQPMLNADAAGVMFTANPLTGAVGEIHIDATWGLGEAVIAARWKPDHFVVQKVDHTIQERVVASKSVMDVPAAEGGIQTLVLPADKQERACLRDEQVVALATLGEKIEAHFKSPQDIEWCRVDERILLLQTRPLMKR
ncbi:MAG TPA: PEP/pyruvate-binding domain-containing protein [Anaerolineae bacterium]